MTKETFGEKWNDKYEAYLGNYEIDEMNFGEREEVIEASLEQVEDKNGTIRFVQRMSRYRVNLLLKSIRKAPFKVSVPNIKKLPIAIAEFLSDVASNLNDDLKGEDLKKFYQDSGLIIFQD